MPRKNRTVLVLGGTSSIARQAAHAFARRGYDILLAARDVSEAERGARDLVIRYAVRAQALAFEAEDYASHEGVFQQARALSEDRLAGVLLAFGQLGDQRRAQVDFSHARRLLDVNLTAAVSVLTHASNHFEERRSGFLAVITSVAGDRGRQSNYVYGAAKGGLAIFLQGLRNRLTPANVDVVTIKPGFVDTGMTFGLPKLFLVADPARVGEEIASAVERRRSVVYTPWFWRYVMLVIRLLPERVFRRLRL